MRDELLDILKGLGQIKEIEDCGDHIEFWIAEDGDCLAYLFFNYDRGVVEV